MITIKELKKKLSTRSRLIGLDLGSKRIGIGICDENHKIATPFKTVIKTNLDDFIKQLKEIIEENMIFKNKTIYIIDFISIPLHCAYSAINF